MHAAGDSEADIVKTPWRRCFEHRFGLSRDRGIEGGEHMIGMRRRVRRNTKGREGRRVAGWSRRRRLAHHLCVHLWSPVLMFGERRPRHGDSTTNIGIQAYVRRNIAESGISLFPACSRRQPGRRDMAGHASRRSPPVASGLRTKMAGRNAPNRRGGGIFFSGAMSGPTALDGVDRVGTLRFARPTLATLFRVLPRRPNWLFERLPGRNEPAAAPPEAACGPCPRSTRCRSWDRA